MFEIIKSSELKGVLAIISFGLAGLNWKFRNQLRDRHTGEHSAYHSQEI